MCCDYLSHQLPELQRLSIHDPSQRVTEDVGVVVATLKFFEVTVQMLAAHLVEGTHQRPLEKAPDTFNAVDLEHGSHPRQGRDQSQTLHAMVRSWCDAALNASSHEDQTSGRLHATLLS